jgi:hypothetical protein
VRCFAEILKVFNRKGRDEGLQRSAWNGENPLGTKFNAKAEGHLIFLPSRWHVDEHYRRVI